MEIFNIFVFLLYIYIFIKQCFNYYFYDYIFQTFVWDLNLQNKIFSIRYLWNIDINGTFQIPEGINDLNIQDSTSLFIIYVFANLKICEIYLSK